MTNCVLFAGCSFTAMPDSWARQMADMFPQYKTQVIAKHGAGNDFIARSIIYEYERQKAMGFDVSHIFVMWSGCERHEILLDKKIFKHLKPWSTQLCTYKRDGEWGEQTEERELDFAWLKSGGAYGSYDFDASVMKIENDMMNRYMENYYRVHSYEYFNFKSLEHFHTVQMFCKANKVTLINLTHRNIIGPIYEVIDSKEFKYIYDLIDWRQWFFHNGFGGLREWTLDNTNKWDDGYDNHPHKDAHAEYIEKFIKPNIINTGIFK